MVSGFEKRMLSGMFGLLSVDCAKAGEDEVAPFQLTELHLVPRVRAGLQHIELVVLSRKILVYRLENQIFIEIHSQRRAAMDLEGTADSAPRFAAFVGELVSVIGHADRARPLRDYCTGLLASEGRRSVEPIAAVTAPAEVSVQHQRLLHFVADAPWPDEPVLAKVRKMVVPAR